MRPQSVERLAPRHDDNQCQPSGQKAPAKRPENPCHHRWMNAISCAGMTPRGVDGIFPLWGWGNLGPALPTLRKGQKANYPSERSKLQHQKKKCLALTQDFLPGEIYEIPRLGSNTPECVPSVTDLVVKTPFTLDFILSLSCFCYVTHDKEYFYYTFSINSLYNQASSNQS